MVARNANAHTLRRSGIACFARAAGPAMLLPMKIRPSQILWGTFQLAIIGWFLWVDFDGQSRGMESRPGLALIAGTFLAFGFTAAGIAIWETLLSIFRWWKRRAVTRSGGLPPHVAEAQSEHPGFGASGRLSRQLR